jgi:hypothetical protein
MVPMEREIKLHIRALAEAYARMNSLSLTAVMKASTGDGSLLTNLDQGRSITFRRADEIRQWFSDRWPAGEPWPEGPSPRPEPREVSEAAE